MGPPFDQVIMAQNELQLIYTAAEMNDKIFLGKLMEIKGRALVTTGGQGSAQVMVKANERLGQTMLGAPTPKATTKAATTPPTRLRSTSPMPSPITRTTTPPPARANSTPPQLVNIADDELDDVVVVEP